MTNIKLYCEYYHFTIKVIYISLTILQYDTHEKHFLDDYFGRENERLVNRKKGYCSFMTDNIFYFKD